MVKASLSLWLVCPGVSKVFQKENIGNDSEVVIHIFSEHEETCSKMLKQDVLNYFFLLKMDHSRMITERFQLEAC